MGTDTMRSERPIGNTLHNLVQILGVKLDSAARYDLYQGDARREGFEECGNVFARLAMMEQESIQGLLGCIETILPDVRWPDPQARKPAIGATARGRDPANAASTDADLRPEGSDASTTSGSAARAPTGAPAEVSVDELPVELRSRVMAATANARYRLVKRAGTENRYAVYALAGDRFVGMLLALRPGGSVDEATDTFLIDAIVDVRVFGDEATIDLKDADHDRQVVVPAEIAAALARSRQGAGRSEGP